LRILLTGAGGQLGMQFLQVDRGHQVIAAYHARQPEGWTGELLKIDLLDPASLREAVLSSSPDWIVHGAAMTNVDACERDPDAAMRANGAATGVLAEAARDAGARFLYVSTDYVFDGSDGPYREDSPVNPVQAYGRSKLEGERRALQADPRAVVARTSAVYGPHRSNFVTWLIGETRAGRPVRIAEDQWVTPTHTRDLVEQIHALIEHDARGIYHTAGAEGCSRLDFAKAACRTFGTPIDLVHPVKAADLPWLAPRPRDARLDTSRIARIKSPFSMAEGLIALAKETRS